MSGAPWDAIKNIDLFKPREKSSFVTGYNYYMYKKYTDLTDEQLDAMFKEENDEEK